MSEPDLDNAPVEFSDDAAQVAAMVAEGDPFRSAQVSDPAGARCDAAQVHAREFDELCREAVRAHQTRTSVGIVVWGEAGIGKSHLLGRLCRWADRENQIPYGFLHNIQPSPERLPRYVLNYLVSRLTLHFGAGMHGTPLYWLITGVIRWGLMAQGYTGGAITADQARRAFRAVVDEHLRDNANAGLAADSIYDVLFSFFHAANAAHHHGQDEQRARLASRWLAGRELDPEEAALLAAKRPGGLPVCLADDESVKSALVALAELAWYRRQPLLLIFDQVDNLDAERVSALTRFLHTLIDHARNLVVITSAVQGKLLELKDNLGAILPAAWDRIAQQRILLTRIGRGDVAQLLAARLEPWAQAGGEALSQRRAADRFYPLGSAWLEGQLGDLVEFRPRDCIRWGRERWRQAQDRLVEWGAERWWRDWPDGEFIAAEPPSLTLEELIDRRVMQKFQERCDEYRRDQTGLAPDADNMAGVVEKVLKQMAASGGMADLELGNCDSAACQLWLYGRSDHRPQVGLCFLADERAAASAVALRGLVRREGLPPRIILVSDGRCELALGDKGREYYRDLRAREPDAFRHIELSFEEYAALAALSALEGDARSGDLEIELPAGGSRAVSRDECIASLARQGLYRNRLMAVVLGS